MKEYDLYVPLRSNRGVPVPPAGLEWLKKLLVKRFGGLTHFPQQNEGFWKLGGVIFRDEIVILRVLAEKEEGQKFWVGLRKNLKRRWRQQEILIVARDVTIVGVG